MSIHLDALVQFLQLILDAGSNVPADAYPGAIPPGYGGFLPGFPGSQLPRIPGGDGTDPYHSASENCRELYNGINALAQDQGFHRMGPHGETTVRLTPTIKNALDANNSCKQLGWDPNTF